MSSARPPEGAHSLLEGQGQRPQGAPFSSARPPEGAHSLRPAYFGDSAPVTATVETKFMQNFNVATPFNPGAGLCAVRNGAGDTEFFSIGSDQAVYNYHADPDSDTGYAAAPIGIFATKIAVTVNASGAIIVFAANATTLTMVAEQPGHAQRWSAPAQLPVPMPIDACQIAGLHAVNAGDVNHLALLVQARPTSPDARYLLVLGTMSRHEAPVFQKTGLVFGSLHGTWIRHASKGMQFACVDGVLVSVSPVTGEATRLPLRDGLRGLSIASVLDADGQSQLFAVLADGNAYRLFDSDGSFSWVQLTQGPRFTQIAAERGGDGAIHLLGVAAGRLFHLRPDDQQPNGYAAPQPILDGTAALAMTSNDDGDVEAFAGNATSLNYLAWNAVAASWDVLPVTLPHGQVVEDFSSYSSDVQLRDASGAPLSMRGVTIHATGLTRIIVNGATCFVDPHRAAQVTTNASGTLNIQQPTNALAVPTLLISVPGVMPPGDTLAISQDMVTQTPLAALTGERLLAAKTPSGAPVLPVDHRDEAQAEAVACAVARVMGLADQTELLAAATGVRLRRARPGVRAVHQADWQRLRRLTAATPQQWRLVVDDGVARLQFFTLAEAQGHLQALRATSRQAGGFVDFVASFGDLAAGASRGLIEISETTLTVTNGVVHAAVRFVVDGVTCLYEAQVDTIEQLFQLTEALLAQVHVHFEALYQWLGFVFDWPEIVRTAKAMNYTVNQFLGFFQGAVGGMRAFFDQGVGPLQGSLDQLFQQAILSVGNASVGSYADSHEPDDVRVHAALSNNPIFNALLDNASALRPSATRSRALASAREDAGDGACAAIEQVMQACATAATSDANFAPMQRYFTAMGSAHGNPFSSLLGGMLAVVRDLIRAVMSGLQAVVDQLLRLLQSMMSTFTAALNAQWQAPALSPLFHHATGGLPMSTVNLISLAMAIPATALYKQTYRRAPFESDEELTAFEHAWDANTLLRASGLRGESALGSQRALMRVARLGSNWTGLLPQKAAPVVAILGAVAPYFHAGFSAVTDALPASDRVEPLSICGFVSEVLGQAANCPWFYAAGAMGCSGDSASYLNWTYANLGVALELLYLVSGESLPNDVQSVVSHLYGNVHLALSVLASTGQPASDIAPSILALIPETGRILRLSGIVAATEGISLAVLASLDAVCLPVAATISTADTIAHSPLLASSPSSSSSRSSDATDRPMPLAAAAFETPAGPVAALA
jgi:hypothetical protein